MSRISRFGKATHATQLAIACNTCVLYVRASTPDQVNSLDAQKQRATAFCQLKGLVIQETFVDAGVSAVKNGIRERPEAKRMFAYIKKHSIATILVLRLDRAFRSSLDFSRTTTEGLTEGFHFRFIDPDIDYGTPMGRMFAGMEALRAEMECETREQRVDDAYNSLRDKRVTRSNKAGYGWTLGPDSGRTSKSGRPLSTQLPIPAEHAVLRHIKDIWERNHGSHGQLTAIAEMLNARGIPTKLPAGTPMKRTIGKKSQNPRQVTILTTGKWTATNVKSVLAHCVLATDAELPDGLPTFDQATSILSGRDFQSLAFIHPSPERGSPDPAFIHSSSSSPQPTEHSPTALAEF
jgi:DNA invertase Pin-like site-specific DNA recombinase